MLSNLAKVESLIFVSGNDGIDKTELSQLTGILKPALNEYLEQLASKYHDDNTCSFELVQAGEVYRLVTKKSVASLVRKYFESPSVTQLSKAALETLAIIAYKQPVTRIAIENIRGVKASGMIQKLLQYGLIAESGRMDIPGRPIQYKTTDEFLNYFGLSQLSDLPKLKEENSVTEDEDSQQDLYKLFQETINDD